MKWFLLFTLGGTGAVIVALCVILLLIQHRIRCRNRVQPHEPDDVPLFWLVSPQPAARLHRRLVVAARSAQLVAERHRPTGRRARRQAPPTIVTLCDQLVAQAASLDAHLPLAGRVPAAGRREVLGHLARGVAEVERTAARLSVMSAQIAAPTVLAEHVDGMTEMSLRLDALESAHASVREIEAGAGLTSPSALWTSPERAAVPASPPEPRAESR